MTRSPPKQPPRKSRKLPKTSLVKKFGINLTKHIPEDIIQSSHENNKMDIEIENLFINQNESNMHN